jgi:phage-related tail fiber protein
MEYFTLLTKIGAEKIAAATAANTTVALAEIALGDGNGTVPMPDASKTALVNEVYRAPLNDLRVDENNANWLVAEGYVPSDEGNFWVREVGIFDSDGDLIIIGNYSETFKPVTADGVAKDLYMKVITEVSSADAVTLQVDPSVVMASQDYVNERLKDKAEKTHEHNWSEIKEKPSVFPPSNHTHDDIKQRVPTGSIITFPTNTVPNGFLECNGAVLSRTAFADLFKIIGTTYGNTNLNNFRLPDLRGEFIRGWDHGRGIDRARTIGSFQFGTLVAAEMDSVGQVTQMGAGNQGSYVSEFYADRPNTEQLSGKYFTQTPPGQSTYLASTHPNYVGSTRPRNISMMYCIKY